jgi:hypothetical protein
LAHVDPAFWGFISLAFAAKLELVVVAVAI